MKAISIKAQHLKILAKQPGERVIFRQTKNWHLKRWNCVQRRQDNDKWCKITNEHLVVNHQGWTWALWRMQKIMATRTDASGRPHWDTTIYKIKHGVYMTYYLVCKRMRHSIQGVY